ncbi:MAG: hypothetical protein IIC40_08705, partial [Candidatus Marinimicrobia bacterium]|nr:hypothetical protein [Candidatus Neomarinimicrobiota bacterium]
MHSDHAGIVYSQVTILTPKSETVTSLHHISVTVAGMPGAPTTLFINGELTKVDTIRIDGLLDFINIEVPDGPLELMVQSRSSQGKLFEASRSIHILG